MWEKGEEALSTPGKFSADTHGSCYTTITYNNSKLYDLRMVITDDL